MDNYITFSKPVTKCNGNSYTLNWVERGHIMIPDKENKSTKIKKYILRLISYKLISVFVDNLIENLSEIFDSSGDFPEI